MNNLNQISEVFAGLLNIYIVPSNGLTFDDIIEGELQGITLLTGPDYTKIPFTLNSADFNGKSNINKIAFNDNSIELILSGNDLDQVQEFTAMDGNTYILLFEDRLNRFWVSGSPEIPLRFIDKYSTGKAMRGLNGRKIVFESDNPISILSIEEDPTIFDTLAFTVNGNIDIDFVTTESGFVYCRTSDGRTFDVYCNLNGTLSVDNFTSGGLIEIYSGFEIISSIFTSTQDVITAIFNLKLSPNLISLTLPRNLISVIDITELFILINFSFSRNNLSEIEFPINGLIEIFNLDQNNLTSIDLSDINKSRFFNLSFNQLTSIDLSVLNLDTTPISIILNNNNFNQAAIDLIISDILTRIVITGKAGTLNISSNTAPSATGLANISTLEVTYGWTVTHD